MRHIARKILISLGLMIFIFQFFPVEARWLDPERGHWMSEEPLGLDGPNRYHFTFNNPANNVDLNGLDTLVIINGPTAGFFGTVFGDGNMFGHSAIAFTGAGVYSYGNGWPLGGCLTGYLNREYGRRSTYLYRFQTTPEQERLMINYLNSLPAKLPPNGVSSGDTCAARTNGALCAGGFTDPYPGQWGSRFPGRTQHIAQYYLFNGNIPGSVHSINDDPNFSLAPYVGFNPRPQPVDPKYWALYE